RRRTHRAVVLDGAGEVGEGRRVVAPGRGEEAEVVVDHPQVGRGGRPEDGVPSGEGGEQLREVPCPVAVPQAGGELGGEAERGQRPGGSAEDAEAAGARQPRAARGSPRRRAGSGPARRPAAPGRRRRRGPGRGGRGRRRRSAAARGPDPAGTPRAPGSTASTAGSRGSPGTVPTAPASPPPWRAPRTP